MFGKRSAGIGYGPRIAYTKITENFPPPNNYNVPGAINMSVKKKKGKTMGVSRSVKQK